MPKDISRSGICSVGVVVTRTHNHDIPVDGYGISKAGRTGGIAGFELGLTDLGKSTGGTEIKGKGENNDAQKVSILHGCPPG